MISGYEQKVEEARQTIQQLVCELQEMVSQDVHLDPRTHARIIGARGKAIRKLMEEFKVTCLDGSSLYFTRALIQDLCSRCTAHSCVARRHLWSRAAAPVFFI